MATDQTDEQHIRLLEEKHATTIQNIAELQEMEKYMYQNLEQLNSGGSANSAEQEQILTRINELTQMRMNLFNQLKLQYSSTTDELNDNRNSLSDQIAMVGIVEDELNKAKKNYDTLIQNKNNKVRMIEIGTYESQRYHAHISVMKIIAISSVIILILSILLKRNLLPSKVVTSLIVVTISVGLIMVGLRVFDLSGRSNMVYDQYAYPSQESELQRGYETVLQHDEKFFKNAGGELKGAAHSAASGTSAEYQAMKGQLTSAASGGLGSVADTVSTAVAPKETKQTMVSPSQPDGVETFAVFNHVN